MSVVKVWGRTVAHAHEPQMGRCGRPRKRHHRGRRRPRPRHCQAHGMDRRTASACGAAWHRQAVTTLDVRWPDARDGWARGATRHGGQ
eukprot:354096-Chlamydomonas_euryale.AAC.5